MSKETRMYYEGADARAKGDYMSINFGVETIDYCDGSGRIYIAKESEAIFIPLENDVIYDGYDDPYLVKEIINDKIIPQTAFAYYENPTFDSVEFCKIISRNVKNISKPFHMPKTEEIKL